MSDGLQIIGTIVGLFFLGLVMSNPGLFGLPSYPSQAGGSQAPETNTSQLVVNDRVSQDANRERSNFPNSATNNDERGEVIIAQKVRGNSGLTASVGQSAFAGSAAATNYPVMLLIILMLVVIVVLARVTMRKRGKVERQRYGRMAPQYAQPNNNQPQHGYAPQYMHPQARYSR